MNHRDITITTKLRVLGVFAVMLLIALTLVGYTLAFFNDIRVEGTRSIPIYYDVLEGRDIAKIESEHRVIYLSQERAEALLEEGSYIVLREVMRESFLSGNLQMYHVNGGSLYEVRDANGSYYFLNPNPSNGYIPIVVILSILTLGLIFVVYYLIHSSLTPLKQLREQIEIFEKSGTLCLEGQHISHDEVGEVSRAFVKVVQKLNRLQNARKLFLRNIMHEFKTPLAKGKLVTTISDTPHTPLLEKIFDTQQALLEGLGTIESIMSEVIVFDIRTYTVIDLVESAVDELGCDTKLVEVNVGDTLIETDFYYFTLIVKNLLSNAMKYKTKAEVEVYCEGGLLIVANHGVPLNKPFEEYLQPFTTSSENKLESMGLGLYIVQEIAMRMGRTVHYDYVKGVHQFGIEL